MIDQVIIREYVSHDKEKVMNIFRLNTPTYFSSEEEIDIDYYLENEIDLYYVLEIDDTIIGSGGINFSDDKITGKLSWDLLHPDYQGLGLGIMLVKHRLEK